MPRNDIAIDLFLVVEHEGDHLSGVMRTDGDADVAGIIENSLEPEPDVRGFGYELITSDGEPLQRYRVKR
jgi:hypothetical protein